MILELMFEPMVFVLQCRQTKDVYGSCVADGRTCPLMLCRPCLRRRSDFICFVILHMFCVIRKMYYDLVT